MANESDREVWLNFLDEVDEYFNTIESVLIGIAESGTDPERMGAALRAVHTIKGIGSMIECAPLSHLAHRFEDFLKIMTARRNTVQIDAELEMLLLIGIDNMRQVGSRHRQALLITDSWLADHTDPTFERLHNRLGEIQPSDELSLLSEESDTDTAVIMFETEVEELLGRLASVLDDPALPCLQEELEMMVEELHDLGRMLQLDAFTSLCESIQQALNTASPPEVEQIARHSLALWQRSQALVMVGKLNKLPTQLEIASVQHPHLEGPTETELSNGLSESISVLANLPLPEDLSQFNAAEVDYAESLPEFGRQTEATEFALPDAPSLSPPPSPDSSEYSTFIAASDQVPADVDIPEENNRSEVGHPSNLEDGNDLDSGHAQSGFDLDSIDLDSIEAAIENFDPTDFPLDDESSAAIVEPLPSTTDEATPTTTPATSLPQLEFSFHSQAPKTPEETVEVLVEPLETSAQTKAQDLQENTVRVPIKLLNQLNDLFGELIIQRNTMNSRLGQMEDLMALFAQRMVSLDNTNAQLQAFCNQLSVAASTSALRSDSRVALVGAETTASGSLRSHLQSWQSSPEVSSLQPEFDSLEMDRYSDLHLLSQEQRETLVQLQEVTSDVKLNLREIQQASGNLNRTAKSLQINVTRARMRPLSDIVERFPRTVRELSLQYGKTVELKIKGGATLIDRFVAVHLRDPLMHLLRNAFDHGIEDSETRKSQGKPPQGKIEIRATHRGNQTLISISDDGAGINFSKIRDRASQMGLTEDLLANMSEADLLGLIFEPGFSTAPEVTDLSGRGIGMDVVSTNLEQIRSEIKVDTQPGIGTIFTISVPFTLSIVRVLLVESGGMQLAFPTDGIEEMIRLKGVQIFESPEQKVINWEGLTVPLINLDQWLEFRCPIRASQSSESAPIISEPSVLIISHGNRLSGLYIDRFWGEREVVIRQVENIISLPPGFNGCTILEDGNIVPLADATRLLNWIDRDDEMQPASHRWQNLLRSSAATDNAPETQTPLVTPRVEQTTILVVDDSINMRNILGTILERAGYCVEQGKDGQDAMDKLLGGLSVHAIICDIEMPRLDGYGVLVELRENPQLKDIPIIMLTSRSSDKHRQLAMRLGANAYITKPYQDHELLQVIEQVLQPQAFSSVR